MDLFSAAGTECNRVKIGGTTKLLGDPAIKLEKPHTIILFPGGNVEIARTDDGNYWVHVAVLEEFDKPAGKIIDARMDHDHRYNNEGNAALQAATEAGDVNHIAFLIAPSARANPQPPKPSEVRDAD